MAKTKMSENAATGQIQKSTHQVRLPGFIVDDDIGLGDVIKRATAYFGIKPCGGCEERATALNRWIGFKGRQSSERSKGN
jgi:hypothetical protein